MNEYEQGVRAGLGAAAILVEETAQGFEQMAVQLDNDIQRWRVGVPGKELRRISRDNYRESAALMRKQAEDIRALKVTRGR